MSIPVLVQVYDEVRRLSIAGSVVASGDFRLKKLVAPLEQAGQKAPVFVKVAQGVTKLVESSERTSAEALLELSALVNAILYTQGETGQDGPFEPIETTELGQQQTQASARVLKPLLEALSSTGSGRLEIIRDAHERGLFRDLRLVKPALAALDDPYPEIAELIGTRVLPLYGKAILPELRATFDRKGRGGHVRRLALMHALDPDGSREIVKQALDEGSKEVRVVAIECLGSSPEDLSFLLEQARSKAKDVRAAALKALAQSDADDAVAALQAALRGSDVDLAAAPVRASRDPRVLRFALDEAEAALASLLEGKSKKDDTKAVGKLAGRMISLLGCFEGRSDPDCESFLVRCFDRRDELSAVKGEPSSGDDVRERLVNVMVAGPKSAQRALVDAHAALSGEELSLAFLAACRSRQPAEVFDLFSPYLARGAEKKKKRDPAQAKREAISGVLIDSWRWRRHARTGDVDEDGAPVHPLDPRWLELAATQKDVAVVQALARPDHDGANALLSEAFAESLGKSKDLYECGELLRTMVRVRHPGAADALIAAVQRHAKKAATVYSLYWIGHLIPDLPKDALPRLDALLPTLPERAIDYLLDYVTQLRNRP